MGVLRSERALHEYRCERGRFYHVACAATVEECPKCHARVPSSAVGVPESSKPA